jgi:hypothetical protein
VHLVFTLPRELAALALQNKRVVYNLLFQTSAATLLEIARDPRHLGAEIGFFSVLHTWNQRLQHHPHVHCVAAAGGLAPDHTRWISSRHTFFLPVKVLSRVFRGKFVAGLKSAFLQASLSSMATSRHLRNHEPSPHGSDPCSATTGSSMPSHPSEDRNISARTASPAEDHPCLSTRWNCPVCGGSMHVVERFSAAQLLPRSPPFTHLYAA